MKKYFLFFLLISSLNLFSFEVFSDENLDLDSILYNYIDSHQYKKAWNLIKPLADKGEFIAQHYVGYFYEDGLHVKQSIENAIIWYKKAAEQGHIASQTTLGIILNDQGKVDESIAWYEKAAKQGDIDSQITLGIILNDQGKVDESIAWYEKAAKQGSPDAQGVLALDFYNKGKVDESIFWYKKLADQGYVGAQFNLALIFEQKGELDKAIFWYTEVADGVENVVAQVNLGLLFQKQKKEKEMIYWIERAALNKDFNSQDFLVRYFLRKKDYIRSYRWATYLSLKVVTPSLKKREEYQKIVNRIEKKNLISVKDRQMARDFAVKCFSTHRTSCKLD